MENGSKKRKLNSYRNSEVEWKQTNLNSIRPHDGSEGNDGSVFLKWRPSEKFNETEVVVHFDDLEKSLVDYIESPEVDAVIGCAAWLTSGPILDALATKWTAILVNKEDFLRPDYGKENKFKEFLQSKYDNLHNGFERASFGGAIKEAEKAYSYTDVFPAIQCVGRCVKNDKKLNSPRMHHKFFIFGKVKKQPDAPHHKGLETINEVECDGHQYHCELKVNDQDLSPEEEFDAPFTGFKPLAVWTGSFNPTKNASNSFENAVFINDPQVAEFYLNEFTNLALFAEPLNWEHEYVYQERRIGDT